MNDDAMWTEIPDLPGKQHRASIIGTTMVPQPDGTYLAVGLIEGDKVKEKILADFCDQLYGEDTP